MKSQTSLTQRRRRHQRPKDAQRPRAHPAWVASEEAVVAAFKEGIAVAAIAWRAGKTPRAIEWTLRKVGLRTNPHKRPSAAEPGDATAHDQATSFRNQDTAFQRAIIALPYARMLQQMTLTLIEIGQKIVDPPMIAVGDAIQGGTNLYAGAINWVDPDYDERTGEVLRLITLNGEGLQWGTEYVDKIERVLNEAFFLNVLNLPEFDGKQMTATEISIG